MFGTDNPRLVSAKCANSVQSPGAAAMAVMVVVVTVFVASRICSRPPRKGLEMLGVVPLPDASRGREARVPRATVRLATVAAMARGAESAAGGGGSGV